MTFLLFALACNGCSSGEDSDPQDTETTDTADTADSGGEDTGHEPDCPDTLPELPLEYTTLQGFSGSEDFAFDGLGRLVSVDQNGNLTAMDRDGNKSVLSPGFPESAGTAYMPDGHLIVADAFGGKLIKVSPSGGTETLHGGMSYPNGVAVRGDGQVFTADQNTGIVWQIDGETGDAQQLVTGLFNPNGVAIGANGDLYVGSFGGGTVHRIPRDGEGYGEAELFGELAGGAGCSQAGDACMTQDNSLGECGEKDDGELICEKVKDTAACEGKVAGDACTTTLFGQSVESTCQGPQPFCPYTPQENIDACVDVPAGQTCTTAEGNGQCVRSAQGIRACQVGGGDWVGDCASLEGGDACQVTDSHNPYFGTCYKDAWDAYCMPSGQGEEGGLDGIGVDACDNVYVTEYIAGKIWRFSPEGGEPVEAVKLPSSWIPNLHWGSGVGGWETDVLYVMDRDQGRVFELQVGVEGRHPTIAPELE